MPRVCFLFDPTNDWLSPLLDCSGVTVERCAEKAVGFDALFILGYTKLIGPDVLARNGINLVIHESDLPKGRGFSPVQWQVLSGATSIPVCMIEANGKADAGDIIDRDSIELEGHELWPEIRAKQAQATERLIHRFMNAYPNFTKTPQSGTPSTFPRRTSESDRIDPDKTIREQFNHLRIADNGRFPVWFEIDGHRYELRITAKSR